MDEFTNIGDIAEVLGAVASGIAIGQLAASIARSIIAIKEGWSQVQDAPSEIDNLIRQIDSLNRILQHIEDDQSREDIKKLKSRMKNAIQLLSLSYQLHTK